MARKTGPDARTIQLVRDRSGGLCEICGWNEGQQFHHRKPRGMGGTRDKAINLPSNLLHLCYPCHREVESERAQAVEDGHIVSQYANPAEVPFTGRGKIWEMVDKGKVKLAG